MKQVIVAAVSVAALCVLTPRRSLGQNPPPLPGGMTPEQALQLLREHPELGSVLRQRIQQSGLTPEQIRSRLQAAGYDPHMLDAYLGPDTATPPPPGENVLQVVSSLGLTNLADSLLTVWNSTRLRLARANLRLDSIARQDSLAPRLFGLEVFRQPTTQFQPLVTGPVDPSYRLGPGDVLVLVLTGELELAHQLEVTREGFIIIPQVGQIFVNNLTLGQLRNILYDRLGRVYSGVRRGPNATTKFDVTVARVRVNTIRVLGEVGQPGSYTISALGTVLAALYNAGGPTERANFRRIEVRRAGDLVATLDLYDYLLAGDARNDVRLESGDVVFIPVHGPRVTIVGTVTRPAIYELKPGQGMRELLRMAGGVTPQAYLEHATIDRTLPPEQRPRGAAGRDRAVLDVNLRQLLDSTVSDYPLASADSVTVLSVTGPRHNAVRISGSVWHPGVYQLAPGMRLTDLIQAAGGLQPASYTGRAQILRLLPDSTRRLLPVRLPADTAGALAGDPDGAPPQDPELQEFDEITIYSRTEFRPERFITMYGEVRTPGTYPFRDAMTLRDAVLGAGGLRDEAWLMEAEVSRVADNVSGDTLAGVLRAPLDSSYVFDPTSQLPRPAGTSHAPEVPLRPYDNVFIRRRPGWETQRNVVITGEVRFPGRYTLVTKDERLSDLVQRAGGLTPQAYPDGVRFVRARSNEGRIPINLSKVLDNPGNRDNLVLMAGDSIDIPEYVPTVRIEGAVTVPMSVTYVRRRALDFYITAAGGFTARADKKRVYVRQPNGSVQGVHWRGILFGTSKPTPEPGATVVVPEKDTGVKGPDALALFGGLAQVIAAVATLVLVVTRR